MKNFILIALLLVFVADEVVAQEASRTRRVRGGDTAEARELKPLEEVRTENKSAEPTSPEAMSGQRRTRTGEIVEGRKLDGSGVAPAPAPRTAAAATSFTGVVMPLLAATGSGSLATVEQAKMAVTNGEPLGVSVGSGSAAKMYAVVYADGRSASADLAAFAGGSVVLNGRAEQRNGFNVLVVESITAGQ